MESEPNPLPLEFCLSNQTDISIDEHICNNIVRTVLKGERVDASSFTIVLLPRNSLRDMKNEFFHLDVYTDVIAFNLNDEDENLEGEIYISPEQIKLNSDAFGVSFKNELYRVIIHGILHCCGWEDETAVLKSAMHRLEDFYLKKLGAHRA